MVFVKCVLLAHLVSFYAICSARAQTISSECVYSHGKSCTCDVASMTTSTTSSLSSTLASLNANFNSLEERFRSTQDQLNSAISSMTKGNVTVLQTTEQDLAKLQVEIAKFAQITDTEIAHLRQTLEDSDRNFTACKTLERYNQTVSDLPYATHYCGFKDWHLCNYTQLGCYNKLAECFYRGSGRQNTYSGPVEDHTFGSPHGYYLYIDPMKQPFYVNHPLEEHNPRNRTATLLSTVMPPGPQYCIRFWYTMYGRDVQTLAAYVQDADRFFLNSTKVFELSGPQDQYWHMAEIPLKPEETFRAFKVMIEATTNSFRKSYVYNSYSYIAIDDMYVYNTSCVSIPKCPAGAKTFTNGNQSSCYTFHELPVTWYDAVMTCKSEAPNGHLVSINSKAEEDFLLRAIPTDSNSHAWFTSGNDERIEGQFKWTDTGYPYPLNYTNWYPGQPDDINNTQQCLALERFGTGYHWNDVSCNTKMAYICEIHM